MKQVFIELSDPLFCGRCRFLKPKEHEQTSKKEPHRCLIYGHELKHNGMHPHIPRLVECRYDPIIDKANGE